MRCPVCDVALVISSREGIEIDHCPQCRGVWLDRGELDKIIERAAPAVLRGNAETAPTPAQAPDRGYAPRPDDRYREERYRDDRYRDDRYRKKRRSFLEDLFDFD
jgi:Zn-finger nucleic acid-binding protein